MKFTAATVLAGLAVILPLASAADLRELVTFSPNEYASGAEFCITWLEEWYVALPLLLIVLFVCCAGMINVLTLRRSLSNSFAYVPSDTTLTYEGLRGTCTPGDYQGRDVNTKALVTCAVEEPVAYKQPVTDDIINMVHASRL